MLRTLVRDAYRQDLSEQDIVLGGSSSPDELAIFFQRPRGDDRFYRERLTELTRRLHEHIATNGQKIVYPYDRDAPFLPIGHATVFHNPGLGHERQILEAFEQARRDAALNGAIERRERHTVFQDLVLAEDVAILYEPIVNITTREILGHEALVRGPWKSELHAPSQLFQLAEETGLSSSSIVSVGAPHSAAPADSSPARSSF